MYNVISFILNNSIVGKTFYRCIYQEWEAKLGRNFVKKFREGILMSKAELARKAGVSPLTVDRIEKGLSCRMETMRKIILALGYDLSDKEKIFPRD